MEIEQKGRAEKRMNIVMSDGFLYLAAVFIAGCGAYTDLRVHKIYNKLTVPAIFIGVLCNLTADGWEGLLNSLLGITTGFLFTALWILGMLKAGDVKLYMAVGAFGGCRFCGYTMFFSIMIGTLAAVFLLLVRKSGRKALVRLKDYLVNLIYTKKFSVYQPEDQSAYFCFGCCIFAGTLAVLYYSYF